MSLTIHGLSGIPEVEPGADLAGLIADAAERDGLGVRQHDVFVVTHKVVAKAEGRLVDLKTVEPSAMARNYAEAWAKDARQLEVVFRESKRIVRMARGIVITETPHGFVCANAGIDASNVPGEDMVCLLPEDPDGSACRIREGLVARGGADVGVVISDTFGRAWRNGHVNVAIGVAGLDPYADYRGEVDPYGYELRVTAIAVADHLAAAAELVMGKMDMRPVALIRGYEYRPPRPGSSTGRDMVMDPERDLFR